MISLLKDCITAVTWPLEIVKGRNVEGFVSQSANRRFFFLSIFPYLSQSRTVKVIWELSLLSASGGSNNFTSSVCSVITGGRSDTVQDTLGGWELMEGVWEFSRLSSLHGKLIEKLFLKKTATDHWDHPYIYTTYSHKRSSWHWHWGHL